jgi:hypothetical protein
MKLKKFDELNEGYDNKDNYFMTEIEGTDVTINDYGKILHDDAQVEECVIYWDYQLIAKNYGIESIIPTIKRIKLTIIFTVWDDDEEEETPIDYEFDIMNSNIETDRVDSDGVDSIPYYPQEIEIDTLDRDNVNPEIKILF